MHSSHSNWTLFRSRHFIAMKVFSSTRCGIVDGTRKKMKNLISSSSITRIPSIEPWNPVNFCTTTSSRVWLHSFSDLLCSLLLSLSSWHFQAKSTRNHIQVEVTADGSASPDNHYFGINFVLQSRSPGQPRTVDSEECRRSDFLLELLLQCNLILPHFNQVEDTDGQVDEDGDNFLRRSLSKSVAKGEDDSSSSDLDHDRCLHHFCRHRTCFVLRLGLQSNFGRIRDVQCHGQEFCRSLHHSALQVHFQVAKERFTFFCIEGTSRRIRSMEKLRFLIQHWKLHGTDLCI